MKLTETLRTRVRNWLLTDYEQTLVERVNALEDESHPLDDALAQANVAEEYEGDADIVIVYGSQQSMMQVDHADGVVTANGSTANVNALE